jgi:trehalose 6-phosphate synthase
MVQVWKAAGALVNAVSGVSRVGSACVAAASAVVASLASPGGAGALPTPIRRPLKSNLRSATVSKADIVSELSGVTPWTARRLKHTLRARLHGERVVVVANREPCIHDWSEGGTIIARHPVSGLVTALEPVVRACSGLWVAHASGPADRAAADPDGRCVVQTGDASYSLQRLWLSEEEERGYYYGFANEALWPLCHQAPAQPVFRRTDWDQYRIVNERFADAVAAELDSDNPIVLVQDYHLALVPRLLRDRFPRAIILTFWHIPWPHAERFAICPYQEALLDGLLGSSILGFQTWQHCRNFFDSVDRTLEARLDREDAAIVHRRRTTLVRSYPISIEWPNRWVEGAPSIETCRRGVREELRLDADMPIVLSVDRLDYTKGIEERLLTAERVLERGARATFVQIVSPSRVRIDKYREFGERVREEAARINERFRVDGYQPIVLIDRHVEPSEVVRYYRAAEVCYVSSLHDGMNLVAKEFVSAREDERGVLILSRFAGAARELADAFIVNPYDVDGVADVLIAALRLPPDEQQSRMRALRALVEERNVYRWAGDMLLDAARLRQRDDIGSRLGPAGFTQAKTPWRH